MRSIEATPLFLSPIRSGWVLVLICGLLGWMPGLCEARQGGDAVWAGLVFATNEPGQTSGRYDNHPYARRLRPVFGYRFYELLDSDRQPITANRPIRLRLGRDFSARLRWLGQRRDGHLFAAELYRGDRLLVANELLLGRDSPFVIRGPQYGNGQLLFLLMVR